MQFNSTETSLDAAGANSSPDHPAVVTQMRLQRLLQDVQECLRATNACKVFSDRYEQAYYQETYKMKKLREDYNVLLTENQRYKDLFCDYEDVYQNMQECLQVAEGTSEQLQKSHEKTKQELYRALRRIDDLEAAPTSVASAQLDSQDRKRPKLRPISCD